MELKMFEEILKKYFSKLGVALSKSFIRYTNGAISACSFSTHEIARCVSKETGYDFNTSEKGLNYLLCNDRFQIDDHYWRQHIKMVFDLMEEHSLIREDEKIYIQVDFTSNEDFFLILCASVIVNNRSVPLYFTMRNYPRRAEQYDHKKMEKAFLKGLMHILSNKYQYVVVADRGFGNERFLGICEELGFEYMVRVTPNFKVRYQEKEGIMSDVTADDGTYDAEFVNWKSCQMFHRVSNEKGVWYLLSNIKDINHDKACDIYKNRFKIEKCFQDLKSAGFDIEKSKIRKYSKYKKLLAIVMVAHVLLVMLGHVIVVKLPDLLKNSAQMANAILAYFLLEKRLVPYLQNGNCEKY